MAVRRGLSGAVRRRRRDPARRLVRRPTGRGGAGACAPTGPTGARPPGCGRPGPPPRPGTGGARSAAARAHGPPGCVGRAVRARHAWPEAAARPGRPGFDLPRLRAVGTGGPGYRGARRQPRGASTACREGAVAASGTLAWARQASLPSRGPSGGRTTRPCSCRRPSAPVGRSASGDCRRLPIGTGPRLHGWSRRKRRWLCAARLRDDRSQLRLVERFPGQQRLRERVKRGALAGQDLDRARVAVVDDPPDGTVSRLRDGFAVPARPTEIEADVAVWRVALEGERADLIAHAPARNHPAGDLGHLLEVVLGAGRQ